ncbi:MAG: tRNA uridine-5-carboxymethylaminomethyl(34) synthesis GTPase MnmE [Legionellales bacterium]|nr:tRNA uridine-5-carboxymethylaminomethyl(34) synthesis GTPase MnmE [Legionellales bacterium]OUX67060.1 MAG: tRNA uridine-5-carboxymethylaminomethyl(34) synthesis GTPase MnmE [bacterium TMED178]
MMKQDIIVALATPVGLSGIAVIRISGSAIAHLIPRLTGKKVLQPRMATMVQIKDQQGVIVDHCMALYFPAPKSFTGESVLEIHTHGGYVVPKMVLSVCLDLGCRMAEPGEFSLRALYNQKLDLIQAESIHEMITAQTQTQARAALRSMQGDFSKEVQSIQACLTKIRVHFEALIDFSDEEILPCKDQKTALENIIQNLKKTTTKAKQSSEFHRHKRVLLIGAPNVGKSSWLNKLTNQDHAIVTPHAGTTRDLLKETMMIDSQMVEVVDSAGMRETTDVIEQIGVDKTRQSLKTADLLLWLVEPDQVPHLDQVWTDLFDVSPKEHAIVVIINKIDLKKTVSHPKTWHHHPVILVSAKDNIGQDEIISAMQQFFHQSTTPPYLARERHVSSLQDAMTALTDAVKQIDNSDAVLVAEELRAAQYALDNLLGTFSNEDLLGEIFGTFCIGK